MNQEKPRQARGPSRSQEKPGQDKPGQPSRAARNQPRRPEENIRDTAGNREETRGARKCYKNTEAAKRTQ